MRNTIKLAALAATRRHWPWQPAARATRTTTSSGSGSAGGNDNKQIAFVQGVAGDEFYITMECGIKAKAAELGYTVTTQGPQKFDPTLQKPIVDSVTASKPAAILIAPTDVAAMQAPARAGRQGRHQGRPRRHHGQRPVVRGLADHLRQRRRRRGGLRRHQGGQARRRQGARHLHRPRRLHRRRPREGLRGCRRKADPAFKYLGVQYSHNDPATAANLVSAALQKDPDIVGIFATNLFSAEGSATGVRQAGGKDITIVGFDAGPNQIKALEDGTVQALVAQQPVDHRLRRRRAGRRGPDRRHREAHHPDRLHHHHQGEPLRRGRRRGVQVDLLTP